MTIKQKGLKRSLSLPLITFYGLGTILGAGIYVLIGKVAGLAGIYTPFAFGLAALIAAFTGFSYAELSARYPKSAGEAVYVNEGFRWSALSTVVGWMVVITGVVSAATISRGFVGYLHLFIQIPEWLAILLLVLCLCGLALWGIYESVMAAMIITIIEVGGLIFVIWVAKDSLLTLPERWHELKPPLNVHTWSGITLGAFLAFYAFIGFEDMVNVAEEVKQPERNLPKAIFLALGISTLLYVFVALVAVLTLSVEELSSSTAPLAMIVQKGSAYSPATIGLISLFAVVNGALVQIIMASRVVYGLAVQGGAPKVFSNIYHRTQTPWLATLLISLFILVLALWIPLVSLAQTTSFIILCIFALVNLSLVVIKRRAPHARGVTTYPMIIPVLGFLLCLLFVVFQGLHWLGFNA